MSFRSSWLIVFFNVLQFPVDVLVILSIIENKVLKSQNIIAGEFQDVG
jgi:hypothetical protein